MSESSSTLPHSLQKYHVSWTLIRSCSRRWAGGCVSASGGVPSLLRFPRFANYSQLLWGRIAICYLSLLHSLSPSAALGTALSWPWLLGTCACSFAVPVEWLWLLGHWACFVAVACSMAVLVQRLWLQRLVAVALQSRRLPGAAISSC